MPTPSSQFTQVRLGDETNAMTDISAYVRSVNIPKGNNMLNATAFAASGGPVTQDQRKGAIQSQVTVEVHHDPTLLAILMRIFGSRTGSTLEARQGNNLAPTTGDPVYRATMTLFSMVSNYATGQDATWTLTFQPTDGGSIVPGWYTN
jgi:hypothetical protein